MHLRAGGGLRMAHQYGSNLRPEHHQVFVSAIPNMGVRVPPAAFPAWYIIIDIERHLYRKTPRFRSWEVDFKTMFDIGCVLKLGEVIYGKAYWHGHTLLYPPERRCPVSYR